RLRCRGVLGVDADRSRVVAHEGAVALQRFGDDTTGAAQAEAVEVEVRIELHVAAARDAARLDGVVADARLRRARGRHVETRADVRVRDDQRVLDAAGVDLLGPDQTGDQGKAAGARAVRGIPGRIGGLVRAQSVAREICGGAEAACPVATIVLR